MRGPEVPVTDADVRIEFGAYDPPENYVWIPDSFEIMVEGPDMIDPVRFSYAALEHLLLLLEQLEAGESGRVLFGTGSVDVTIEGETTTLSAGMRLVATQAEQIDLVLDLVASVFAELADAGISPDEVIEHIPSRKFESLDVRDVCERATG